MADNMTVWRVVELMVLLLTVQCMMYEKKPGVNVQFTKEGINQGKDMNGTALYISFTGVRRQKPT